jgi:hypothetical protein
MATYVSAMDVRTRRYHPFATCCDERVISVESRTYSPTRCRGTRATVSVMTTVNSTRSAVSCLIAPEITQIR